MFNWMPKYTFSYINEEKDGEVYKAILTRALNSGMIQTTDSNNVLIFNSESQQTHQFIVIREKILLDQELATNLTNLILRQLRLTRMIPTKMGLEAGEYKERFEGHIDSIVSNLVFHKWSYTEDDLSVLDMAADIIYRIAAINHPFTNGNKRTAIFSAGAFLNSVGLYLSFYKLQTKVDYLEKWEDFMIDIAKSREINQSEDETLKNIKNRLFESISINFNENMIWTKTKVKKIKEAENEDLEF